MLSRTATRISTKDACVMVLVVVLAAIAAYTYGGTGGVPAIAGEVGEPSNVAFTVKGKLHPGSSLPVNVILKNPGDHALTIRFMELRIEEVDAPRADDAHPCSVADFSVAAFSGTYGFAIPPSSTRSLSDLSIPKDKWPRIGMHNTALNQDGCKESTLKFAFVAADTTTLASPDWPTS